MRITHQSRWLAPALVGLALVLGSSAMAAEKRYPEPPAPGRPNFPQRPANEPRLTNPIPQPKQNWNPQNDPDVRRGYQEQYRKYWQNK